MAKEKLEKYNPVDCESENNNDEYRELRLERGEYDMRESLTSEVNQEISKKIISNVELGVYEKGNYSVKSFVELIDRISEIKPMMMDIIDTEFIQHNDIGTGNSIGIYLGMKIGKNEVTFDTETIVYTNVEWISKQVAAFVDEEAKYAFITIPNVRMPVMMLNDKPFIKSSTAKITLYKFDGKLYIVITTNNSILLAAGKVSDADKEKIYQLLRYIDGDDMVTEYMDSVF